MLSIIGIFICQQKHIGRFKKRLFCLNNLVLKSFRHFAGDAVSKWPDRSDGPASVYHSELMVNFSKNGFRGFGYLQPQTLEFLNHLHGLGSQVGMAAFCSAFMAFQQRFAQPFSIFRSRPHMDRYPISGLWPPH